MLKILQKHGFFSKIEKYFFHSDKICFLDYVILSQKVHIEEENIEAVKTLPKLKSLGKMKMFIGFVNFYQYFISGFTKIAALLTSILTTTVRKKTSLQKFSDQDLMIEDSKVSSS